MSSKNKGRTRELIEWRRQKIIELKSQGITKQVDIARTLKVSEASISVDLSILRQEAKKAIKEYVTDHLPEQYQVCLAALDTIIKHAFEISQSSEDNKEKLAALELFKDTHIVKLELLADAPTIDSALGYIRNKQGQQQELDPTNDEPVTGDQTSVY